MMLNDDQVHRSAEDLFNAERTGIQIGLVSDKYPDMDLDDAYRIQGRLVELKKKAGRQQIGWKIGLTSRVMQRALSIDTPDSGVLFDDMQFNNGTNIPPGRFIEPRIEAEIAFRMKADLSGAGTTETEVLVKTECLIMAIEILDTRVVRKNTSTGKLRTIYDTVADNAANAGIVLGASVSGSAFDELRWMGAVVKRNGVVEETGLGAAVLDNPLTSVVWLARRLARYGMQIMANDIVLSGSFIRPIEAPPGSFIEADFGSYGKVSCNFT